MKNTHLKAHVNAIVGSSLLGIAHDEAHMVKVEKLALDRLDALVSVGCHFENFSLTKIETLSFIPSCSLLVVKNISC